MPYINDEVFDQGLEYAETNGARIDICSSEPASYGAIAGVSLGNKIGLTTSAPQNGATSGRRVIVPAITDGSVTDTGIATSWALSDGSAILVAAGLLSSSQGVTSGNLFTLDAISITITDAT